MELSQSQTQYQPRQIFSVLEGFRDKQISGTLHFTADLGVDSHVRSRVLVLRNGEIIFGGASIPDNVTFVKSLGKKLDRKMVETAVNFSIPKLTDKNSTRELLEMIMRLRSLTWAEVEKLVFEQVVQTIEQLLPYAGQIRIEQGTEQDAFDLTPTETGRGLDWSRLKQEVDQRQQVWQTLAPLIPSMDAIPRLKVDRLSDIPDASVRQQIELIKGECSLVDRKDCTLVEIAAQLEQDPLELGKTYLTWVEAGWIAGQTGAQTGAQPSMPDADLSTPKGTSAAIAGEKRPLILSVDDSTIVQTTIKRILADRYEVMLADNAIAALNILNANEVDLLLLDVTMPDVDGLEFCKTLRDIPKFKNLPIVMVTAKDTLVDKFKGFMAGSNQYLYKPIEAAHLLEVVGSLISS
jgi:CheY-like chemotaxis protein